MRTPIGSFLELRPGLRFFWEKTVPIDDGCGNVDQLAIAAAGVVTKKRERAIFVDRVTLHR
jgi:hypothetical protein